MINGQSGFGEHLQRQIDIKFDGSDTAVLTGPIHTWEGDLICGSKNSYIATVVERQTRFTLLVKVEGKKTDSVAPALARQMAELSERLKQNLT